MCVCMYVYNAKLHLNAAPFTGHQIASNIVISSDFCHVRETQYFTHGNLLCPKYRGRRLDSRHAEIIRDLWELMFFT